MTKQEYVDAIKLEITGGVLELEIPDETLGKVVDRALKEIQRYIDSTELMTVPYASCIDLKDAPISSIFRVYRTEGLNGDSSSKNGGYQSAVDPMYAQTWMAFTNGGTMYNLNDYLLNYLSYSTLMQMRNTTSTDMAWKQDHQASKLYINSGFDNPGYVTIEYVPIFKDVDQIKSDYWSDKLLRLAVAMTKQILGRIRTRFTSSSSLWTMDGETMLTEGNAELTAIRESLKANSQIILPID